MLDAYSQRHLVCASIWGPDDIGLFSRHRTQDGITHIPVLSESGRQSQILQPCNCHEARSGSKDEPDSFNPSAWTPLHTVITIFHNLDQKYIMVPSCCNRNQGHVTGLSKSRNLYSCGKITVLGDVRRTHPRNAASSLFVHSHSYSTWISTG